jgi:inorganic triphosphatase YgiF
MRLPSLEIELKFKIEPAVLGRLLSHPSLQGAERVARLRSVYFDTVSHDLRRCGLGLRVRDDGEGFVQTVKRQAGPGGVSRGEWEAKVSVGHIDPTALAETPVEDILRGRANTLTPIFTTVVDRKIRTLRRRGAIVEAAFDHGTVSSGDRTQPICELELELKSGDQAALFRLGRRLVSDLSVCLSFESKAERGYRLVGGTEVEPRRAALTRLTADTSTAEAFRSVARACLAQVCANGELLRDVHRPEAIHQIRVGLRRLRAALAAFKPMLVDDARARIEAELKWLAGELDPARDLDVFIQQTFRPAVAGVDRTGLARLGRQLLKAQTDAYDRAVAAIRSRAYALLLFDTAEWIEVGDWSRSQDAARVEFREGLIKPFAANALDHVLKDVRRRSRDFPQLDPADRHKLRIRAKRLRYAAEFFSPLFADHPKRTKAFLGSLQQMQNKLGALNDIAVARRRGLGKGRLDRPELALATGHVVALREGGEPKLLHSANEEVLAFRSASPFWRD